MRILHVMAGGAHGGAETACIDMCLAMHEAGQTVALATRPNDIRVSRVEQAGVDVHTLRFGGMFDVFSGPKLKQIIKEFKPDIVQSWMSRASSFVPRWDASMGIPEYKTIARLGGYYKLKYFKNIQRFVTITPCIRDYLIKEGVPGDHVRFINNFADVEPARVVMKREDFGVPADATLLMGLGRLHTAKAFDVLIKAIAPLEDVYLWVAGEGPERSNLEALINDLKLSDRVTLLGWQEDRAALFQASDICIFASRYEPFGTVFAQAWAQETPVIVSDADGPRQFVKDGEDGLVIPRDNVEALRGAIEKLMNNSDLTSELVAGGTQRFHSEFTQEQCVQRYLDFYQSI